MKEINYLIGNQDIITTPFEIFSLETINFLSEFSKAILSNKQLLIYPDIVTLGFWCRKSNINMLLSQFTESKQRIGKGLCFHIAPSNIPVNFAFSFIFSLLSGNANIVRIPSKEFPQSMEIINIIKSILPNYPAIQKRTAFISYDKNNNSITEFLSNHSDIRMIWGGDNTINKLKQIKTSPKCLDICFSDRYSIAIINGDAVQATTQQELERLVQNFYNDTYLIDQNACSSPKTIYWLNDNNKARERFWTEVERQVSVKYSLQDATAMDKFTKICSDIITKDNFNFNFKNNQLYQLELSNTEIGNENLSGNAGYFFEKPISDIYEILPAITGKYQTITYFGINPENILSSVIKNNVKGIDRIVPIGQALDISIFWDGYDLIRMLSRKIMLA